ncbi:MAG: peptidylprolyl isomerase [Epsilonproteobacteria bacterium]|nr:MAG: peptidylprolyl isomerase [Campylobacterota bacterium]
MLGCGDTSISEVTKIGTTYEKIDYLTDIKPILDKRCVSCHSCYNSPCQAKYSSYEGVDRGGSKDPVYDATRLYAADATRLFIDAKNTEEWREKGFYSLIESLDSDAVQNDSIMIQMLREKKEHPQLVGKYDSENDKHICPKNTQDINKYIKQKPNHGMPYGFPALTEDEYNRLTQWLHQGAAGPDTQQQKEITSSSTKAAPEIEKWETFLNATDAKHMMTARYLYEHYFLAHINFKKEPKEFYELVRSTTAAPHKIDIIPTLRPFDDPLTKKFYYRFKRIHSTIVHKTHMVVEFNDAELARIRELFIKPTWLEKPHIMDYESKMSANPFVTFFQIPIRSRYQFLLDHNHYIVMAFIRGPVCRGQIALNVIHDHFWVMFQNPEYDLSVKNPSFLLDQAENLSMPIQTSTQNIWEIFDDTYQNKYTSYFNAKQEMYDQTYPNGLGLEGIWKGNSAKDSPLLSIYRHFNSASVHRGVVGQFPRTMWVIDYPQFERIYYTLVAGFDVYGNISHQSNIRRYMDFLRTEGEENFLSYLPKDVRLDIFKSWYIGDSVIEQMQNHTMQRGTQIDYNTTNPQREFIEKVISEHILKSTGIEFDAINYFKREEDRESVSKTFPILEEFRENIRSMNISDTGFITYMVDHGANLLHLRIIMPDGEDLINTLVINLWHDNVNSLFDEESRFDESKNTIDIIPGSIGSYPNIFAVVDYKDLPDLFDLISHFDGSSSYTSKFEKYFISRSDKNFWETFDWFQMHFKKEDPLNAGLYDLNRYFPEIW